jgi:hypothetical protein
MTYDPGTFGSSKAAIRLAEELSSQPRKIQQVVSHWLHRYFTGAADIEDAVFQDTWQHSSDQGKGLPTPEYPAIQIAIFNWWKSVFVERINKREGIPPIIKSLSINIIKARKLR